MAAFGGRCENCEQLHKEGSYCPVCDKARSRPQSLVLTQQEVAMSRQSECLPCDVHCLHFIAIFFPCQDTLPFPSVITNAGEPFASICDRVVRHCQRWRGQAGALTPIWMQTSKQSERPKQEERTPTGVYPAQVWLPTDKNMAGCDNCSFWVHDHCDPAANVALHAPSDIPFYCAPCKRQAEAHAKLTALRAAEAQLRAAQPRRPRSAYHLFSLELNKCALSHVSVPPKLPWLCSR